VRVYADVNLEDKKGGMASEYGEKAQCLRELMTASEDSCRARAEGLLQRLRTNGYLDGDSLNELRGERSEVDLTALAGYLSAIDANADQLLDVLRSEKALVAISATRRSLADSLVACVRGGAPFPDKVRHAFGVIGPYHDTAIRSAVRSGSFCREDAVRAAFDGPALRSFLKGQRVEVEPIFDSTIGVGSRQSVADQGAIRFEAPFEVRNALGSFRLLVSNSVELWRAAAMAEVEPETIAWLDRTVTRESVVYDVGANIGYFTLYAWCLGAASVVAFEPEPLNFSRLNENLFLNGASSVLALPVALSDRSRIARFGYRDFVRGASSPHGVDPQAPVHCVGCVCDRLDSLRQDRALPPPTHIKVDVDGYEPQVLAGAGQTFADSGLLHVLMEMHLRDACDLVGQLARFGFRNTEARARGNEVANYVFERW
jgi:FkbM family methyltransferase